MNDAMMKNLVGKMKNEIQLEYQSMKNSSKTYSELKKSIDTYCKNLSWDGAEYYSIVEKEMYRLFDKDMLSVEIKLLI